ncbi:MAG: DUF222 domain-containing protein [Nocardioidaceae bacterium]
MARIDRIRLLEQLKSAASAAQARESVTFKQSQLAEQEALGLPARERGAGITAQLALARQESPHLGARFVGLAEALVTELPHTMAALTAGIISEWRATVVTRETACLTREDRARVDAHLAGRLAGMSNKQIADEARKCAYELDPYAAVARSRKAVEDRRVTMRPAPDTMAIVSALLPVAQGVALYAALKREADSKRAHGDELTRGQVMADTLVERVTGQPKADQVPLDIRLVMTDRALLTDDQTPARLDGYGAIPAPVARDLIRDLDEETRVRLRQLLTDPTTGRLTAMESVGRDFDGGLRTSVIVRDEFCRTPWCGAPIRHVDHAVPASAGGQTSEANGQGLCEACNYAKEAPGWRSQPSPGGAGESISITTPTGHTYISPPPPLPGAPPRATKDLVEPKERDLRPNAA